MLSSEVGAVQPVAVTSRSHSIDDAVGQFDGFEPRPAPGPHDVAAPAGVDDADDLDTGVVEVGGGRLAFGVGGEARRPAHRAGRPTG